MWHLPYFLLCKTMCKTQGLDLGPFLNMTLFFSLWFPYFFSFFSVRDGSAWPGHEKKKHQCCFFLSFFCQVRGKPVQDSLNRSLRRKRTWSVCVGRLYSSGRHRRGLQGFFGIVFWVLPLLSSPLPQPTSVPEPWLLWLLFCFDFVEFYPSLSIVLC